MNLNEDTPNVNLERARAYLRAIETRASEEELTSFFSPDVVVEQFPNRLVPKVVKSSLADVKRESEMGKKSVTRQSYTVRNAVASGEWVALQVDWEGALAIRRGRPRSRSYDARVLRDVPSLPRRQDRAPEQLRLLRAVVNCYIS